MFFNEVFVVSSDVADKEWRALRVDEKDNVDQVADPIEDRSLSAAVRVLVTIGFAAPSANVVSGDAEQLCDFATRRLGYRLL